MTPATWLQDKLLPTASGRTLVHVAAAYGQVRACVHMHICARVRATCICVGA